MDLTDRLSQGVKAMFGADLLDKLSQGVLIVLLTRVLFTPEEYGELNFVLSAVGIVTVFATLGLPKSAARYVTEFGETDPGQIPYVLRRSFAYLAVLVGLVAGAIVLVGGPTAELLGVPSLGSYLFVGSAIVVARAFSGYFSALFQGFNRVTWTAALKVVKGVGRLVLVVSFVALGYGVLGALAGYLLAAVAATAVGAGVLYYRFYVGITVADTPAPKLTKRLLEYSIPLTATRGANVLDKKVDTILVGVLLNMTAVGYYTIAKQVSDLVATPAATFGFTISPAIGEERSGNRNDRAARLYERSLEYVLLLYIPGIAGLILVAGPMVRYVFGTDYLAAVPVVQVFSGFILVNAINKVTSDGLDFLGRARSRAIIKTAMAISNVLLNLLLIPMVGVVGAAIATVITYTVYTLSNVYFIHQELGIDVAGLLRWLGIVSLVTLGMATMVWAVMPYVSGLLTLLGAVLLGVVVWALLAVGGGVLDLQEVRRFLT